MDEAEVAEQKHINVQMDSFDSPSGTYVVDCLPLKSCSNINSSFILHTVDDIL